MKTKHVKDKKISALIDGELSPEESKTVSRHIDQCRICQDKFRQWQRLDHYIQQAETKFVSPPFLEQRVLAHVRSKTDNKRVYRFNPQFYFTAVGLVVLGIFLGTLIGARLSPLLTKGREDIDLIAVLSSQDTYSGINLDFINQGES